MAFPHSNHVKTFTVKDTAYLFIVIALSLVGLYLGSTLIAPIVLAGIISLLMYPICRYLEKQGIARIPSILLAFLIITLVVGGVIFFVTKQAILFADDFPNIKKLVDDGLIELQYMYKKSTGKELNINTDLITDNVGQVFSSSLNVLSGTMNAASALFNYLGLVPIYVFLILLYRKAFKQFLFMLSPNEKHWAVRKFLIEVTSVVQAYLSGLLIVMTIVCILNTIALSIIGIPYAFFFGVIASLLMIFPYIGILVGSGMPALYALMLFGRWQEPVLVIACMSAVQMIEGNFITPLITGNKVKINALTSIVGIVFWGYLWGMIGLILAIPLLAISKVLLDINPSTRPIGYLLGNEMYSGEARGPSVEKRIKTWIRSLFAKKKKPKTGLDVSAKSSD